MTKDEAAKIFGDAHADLARALDMTRGGISQWPDELTEAQQDRVIGAAIRLGKAIPERFQSPRNGAAEEHSGKIHSQQLASHRRQGQMR